VLVLFLRYRVRYYLTPCRLSATTCSLYSQL